MDLIHGLGRGAAAGGGRRDEDDILALRPGAAGCAQAVAGHARRLVVDRTQPVAVVAHGVIGHPFLDEQQLRPAPAHLEVIAPS